MAAGRFSASHDSRPGSAASNDRWSVASPSNFNVGSINVNPPPAFVAPAAAQQIIVDNNAASEIEDSLADAHGEANRNRTLFSPEALTLVNGFLDAILHSLLATARSGKLKKLRPAITEVLKPKLAREAIASADEELRELLDGEEEEEEEDVSRPASRLDGLSELRNGAGEGDGFDLTLTWKRTRLRIMVYTRLGDLEDEDEDRFLDDDEDFHRAKEAALGDADGDIDAEAVAELGLVSPAAAIFLTSVIEYLAEQTVIVAGQAALTRIRKQRPGSSAGSRSARDPKLNGDKPTPATFEVLDLDMEKVALNPTMGRLWRTWRKRSRGTPTPGSPNSTSRRAYYGSLGSVGPRSIAGESSAWSETGSRRPSIGTNDRDLSRAGRSSKSEVPDIRDHSELEMACNIALPMPEDGDARDVKEIEIPGLAKEIHDGPIKEATIPTEVKRRASFGQHNWVNRSPTDLTDSERPALKRLRSNSTPAPPGSWLSTLLAEASPKDGAVPDEKHQTEEVIADNEESKLEPVADKQGEKGKGGIIAGAAAAVGSVIAVVVGSRGNETDDDTDSVHDTITSKDEDEHYEDAMEDTVTDEGTATPAVASEEQGTPGTETPKASKPTALPTEHVFELPANEVGRPKSIVVIEQEAALSAAEKHMKRMSKLAGMAPVVVTEEDEDTLPRNNRRRVRRSEVPDYEGKSYGDDPEFEDDIDEEDEGQGLTRQKHLSAVPAPLSFGKDTSPGNVSPLESGPISRQTSASKLNKDLPPIPPEASGETAKHSTTTPAPGDQPNELPQPSKMLPAELTAEVDPKRSIPSPLQIKQPQPGGPKPSVDDDYDPFSSAGYPTTGQYSPSTQQAPKTAAAVFDASTIGVAQTSDRAIPYSRTPSPPGRTAQRDAQASIEGQMEGFQQQKSAPPPAVVDNKAASETPPPTYPVFSPAGKASGSPRPQSAHIGDSGLAGHSDVNSFASPPSDVSRSESPSSIHRAQLEQQSKPQPPSAYPPRTTSALQKVSSADDQGVPRQQERATQQQQQQQQQQPTTSKFAEKDTKTNGASNASPAAFAAAVAGITVGAKPVGTRPRGNTNGSIKSGKEGDGLTPRPIDPHRASTDNKPRDFEELLASGENEPVKYTLTPVRVSNDQSTTATRQVVSPVTAIPTQPRESSPHSTASANRTSSMSKTGIPGTSPKHGPTPSQQATYRTTPSQSHSRQNTQTLGIRPQGTQPAVPGAKSASATDLSSAPFTSGPPKRKMLKFEAREPRVKPESMRDFADFIRTTGPDREMNVVPIIQRAGTHGSNRNSSASNVELLTTNGGADGIRKSNMLRSNMQARDPAVKNDGNKDLIHFIRQGPPGSQPASSNEALVAPFASGKVIGKRTTLDGAGPSGPTANSSYVPSSALSNGSRSPMVDNQPVNGEDGIKKTRRRVKDPYAIDISDDDEDLLTALPGASSARQKRPEESLIEFLRNSEPPSGNAPQPLDIGLSSVQAANGANGNGTRPSSSPIARTSVKAGNAKGARVETSQSTRELSDFLRDSGPPGSGNTMPTGKAAKMFGGPEPVVAKKEAKGGKGIAFWKRKNAVEA